MQPQVLHGGRPNTLKRTISKCSMTGSPPDYLVSKKASPGGHRLDAEPVLLPREHGGGDSPFDAFAELEPEASPPPFDSAYYERLLDCSAGLTSPSPCHVLYASEPTDSQATEGCEALSAASLVALLLEYLRDVGTIYGRAMTFSFAHLGQLLQSVPFALRQMQTVAQKRLGIAWHLVGGFVQNVAAFICDEDLREASVGELAAFLQSCQAVSGPGNVFANLFEFFRDVLASFKQFLTKLWLQNGRISFPCEFGKKSDTLFLCMECHREHM
ncbi:hypothetical protein BBJ28_00003042 [Nothophytophthora sp. Chile5]|nr:hypothetical protein BBJ28_00003042 [Nothophytophthora sp. Chile5]